MAKCRSKKCVTVIQLRRKYGNQSVNRIRHGLTLYHPVGLCQLASSVCARAMKSTHQHIKLLVTGHWSVAR